MASPSHFVPGSLNAQTTRELDTLEENPEQDSTCLAAGSCNSMAESSMLRLEQNGRKHRSCEIWTHLEKHLGKEVERYGGPFCGRRFNTTQDGACDDENGS